MKTLLATLLAAMALLVLVPAASAMKAGSLPSGSGPVATPVTITPSAPSNTSSGGTEWYAYALVGLVGVMIVGGATYLVYTTAHGHKPHGPVGTH